MELPSLLLQCTGEGVGLEKVSEDASSPLKLVKKVKQRLRINDISTKRDVERKWHQTMNQGLRKVSLDAWTLWKSHFVEDSLPHTLAAENLTRHHPVGAQGAYTLIADATNARKTPDVEKFTRGVKAFAAKIGGLRSRAAPKASATACQGQDADEQDLGSK